jgi:hypothetical protein
LNKSNDSFVELFSKKSVLPDGRFAGQILMVLADLEKVWPVNFCLAEKLKIWPI